MRITREGQLQTTYEVGESFESADAPARDRPFLESLEISTFEAAVPALAAPKSVLLDVPQLDQGDTNACGTTSMAMISAYFGKPVPREEIDREIRAGNTGTAVDNLISWAHDHGFKAEAKNEASLDDVARMLDRGLPVMTLIDTTGRNDFTTHYVVVDGYTRGADGKVSSVHTTDPNGFRATYSAAEFTQLWSDIRVKNVSTGSSRLLLSFAPAGTAVDLPKSSLGAALRGQTARNFEDGSSDFLSGVANGRLGDVVGGALETLGSIPGLLLGQIRLAGFRELAGVTSTVVNAVVEPIKAIGNAISGGLKAAGRLVRRLFH